MTSARLTKVMVKLSPAITTTKRRRYVYIMNTKKRSLLPRKLKNAMTTAHELQTRSDVRLEQVLAKRDEKYGPFKSQGVISQSIKDALRDTDRYYDLDPDMREALEMIANKISRVLNGDPNYVDHWIDIAGYATLIAVRLKKEQADEASSGREGGYANPAGSRG